MNGHRWVKWKLTTLCALVLPVSFISTRASAEDEAARFAGMSGAEVLREGNRLLNAGDASSALDAYRQAEQLQPNSREVAFAKGLGHYALKQFDDAREAFEKVVAGKNDSLADDAVYSLGTCDHREALDSTEDPKAAIQKLESAMQRYQNVLSRQPDHQAAQDANRKAATVWKQMKERLQQQQQQNQGEDDNQNEKKNQDQSDQQQSEQDQEKKQDSPNAQDQPQEQPNKGDQSQDQQQQSSQSSTSPDQQKPGTPESESKEKKEQDGKSSQEQKENQQGEDQSQQASSAESKAQQQERNSREQAQRKLREMIQTMRDRKKERREEVRRVPVAPVEKDW